MKNQNIQWGKSLQESFVMGLLSLVIFIPIRGMVIEGWGLKYEFFYPIVFSLIIFFSRFLLSIGYQIKFISKILNFFFQQKMLEIVVAKEKNKYLHYTLIAALLVAVFILPFLASKYWVSVFILALIYVLLGLGLNIVVGMAGMLDLGFVAFYAVGAYSLGLISQYWGLGFWSAIPIAILISATAGVLLGFPVLRAHGDYLAIITLGFGEIIRLVLNNWLEFTGGPNGLKTPSINFFGLEFKRRTDSSFFDFFDITYGSKIFGISTRNFENIFIYLVLLVFVIAVVCFVHRLKTMPIGRAWEALREDEIACKSLGLNHVNIKLAAFCLGASIGGLGGVFFGVSQGFISPQSFNFFESALIVAIVVLGGLGSIPGVILAAIIFTVLPEVFRAFSDFRVLIFGFVMVLMMIWRPKGLLRVVRSRFSYFQSK